MKGPEKADKFMETKSRLVVARAGGGELKNDY